MQPIFAKIEEIIQGRLPASLCIVTETHGSTPRKTGAKMIVYADGSIFGCIGGGAVEKEVAEMAANMIRSGKPARVHFNLDKDLEMHCGGSMEVYIEPLVPLQRLYIFGAGHIGKSLAGFARELDFSVTIIDPREGIFNESWCKEFHCIPKNYLEALSEADFDESTYVVIVTPKHVSDEEILAAVARKPHAYIGMIGSSRKVEALRNRFLRDNILSKEELDDIDMPIGIQFLAETPQEIAISILAKLIDVRNSIISANL